VMRTGRTGDDRFRAMHVGGISVGEAP
jgi:hypothetical protein